MDFKKATETLCAGVSHEELAKALGVSVSTVRQARLDPKARAHRSPPKDWRYTVIRLAESQIMRCRHLIESVRKEV